MSNGPDFGQQPEKSRDDYIREWDNINTNFAVVKVDEKKARDAAVKAVFGATFESGTNTVDLGNGYKFKCQYATTYKFIVPDGFQGHPDRAPTVVDAVDEMVRELRAHSNEGGFIADRIVKWKPEVVASEYKDAPDSVKRIVDRYIESKNAVNSVELVKPPKAKV